MNLSRVSLIVLAVGFWSAPAVAQVRQACLHTGRETPVEAQRRQEAAEAADLINRLLGRLPNAKGPYPTWEDLAESRALPGYQSRSGATGDLARKMRWGTDEPLPGWRIHYVAGRNAYAFSLTDVRDPCKLTYSSNDTGVVIEGRPITNRSFRIVPLDSSQ